MDSFGNDSASCFLCCCFTLLPVYHGPDDECTRQKPHKRLVATNHRIPLSSPPMFPPSVLKVLSVCLCLGLGTSGESSLRPPASPPLLPAFLSSSLLFFDLLKPSSLYPSSHTLSGYKICVCVCVVY
ncbi:uncharacterized [Lates japonicus]